MHRIDLDAGHQLRFLDRLLDRVDGGLEVDDHAAADAVRFGDAEADDVDAAPVHELADDGRHFRCADVEADQISFFSRHCSPLVSASAQRLVFFFSVFAGLT